MIDSQKPYTHLILQGAGMHQPLTVDAPMGSCLIDVVRDLVRDGKISLQWRCGHGTCGTCVVWLEHEKSAQALPISLSNKERNVLARQQRLSPTEQLAATLPDTPNLPRLACHVMLATEHLYVRW